MSTLLRRSAVALAVLTGALVAAMPALGEGQAGTTLTADVTANAVWTRTYDWTIDKSVQPDTWNLFQGDSGTSLYTVDVTKDGYSDVATISGQVCVFNGGAVATENLTIVANLTMPPDATIIDSTSVDLSGNPVLDPGETGCYPYEFTVATPVAGANYKVTADITITNHSGHLGVPFGPSPSATTTMPASPTLVNGSVNVTDTNGGSWTFGDSGSVSYSKTFACDADEGLHENTASIVETGDSDSASVTVNCYALDPTKTAATSFDRTYLWKIEKSADQSTLTLGLDQQYLVNYTVVVSGNGYSDSNFAVAGAISIYNPAPIDAVLNGVADVVSPDIAASVDCGVSFPYTLAAGGTLSCTYDTALPDASSRTNTATVTQQNFDYDYLGVATPAGTTDTTATAGVDFAGATMTEIDEMISVSDTYAGDLGTVAFADLPKTFSYSRWIGPYGTCGTYQVTNTAAFVTNDTGSTGSSSWTVDVNVPCGGCTLTIGYWKTHAGFTGNNADMVTEYLPIWLGTSGGAKSVQVITAAQAVSVLSMSGDAANGINKLYAQLLGAKLNIADGASDSAVAATISAADAFLATNDATNWSSLSKTQQKQVLLWATTLDNYNNGLIGPGHCSQ